jgi:hypothetical protein
MKILLMKSGLCLLFHILSISGPSLTVLLYWFIGKYGLFFIVLLGVPVLFSNISLSIVSKFCMMFSFSISYPMSSEKEIEVKKS